TPSTTGSRDVMASTLSRLICAVPVISTALPLGPGTACRRSSCASERSENSGAVLSTRAEVIADDFRHCLAYSAHAVPKVSALLRDTDRSTAPSSVTMRTRILFPERDRSRARNGTGFIHFLQKTRCG